MNTLETNVPVSQKSILTLQAARTAFEGSNRAYAARVIPSRSVPAWDLSLEAGLFTAILGPNGAGKSTLLQVFAGERALAEGACTVPWAQTLEEAAIHRALLPQDSPARMPLTGAEVVGLAGRRLPRASIEEALSRFEASSFAERRVASLSGGESKKVHLARVCAQLFGRSAGEGSEPRLLLLDEPTAPLDPRAAHRVLTTLGALAKRQDFSVAVVAILHDVALAARFADRLLLLDGDGAIVASGAPRTVLTAENVHHAYGIHGSFVEHAPGKSTFVFTP